MAGAKSHSLRNYIIRRLLLMVPTFLGVTFIVFMICQFVPGGPIDQMMMRMKGGGAGGESGGGSSGAMRSDAKVTEKELESLRKYYGFDKPPLTRYGIYLLNLAKLEFGDSIRYTKPSMDIIKQRFPISIYYGLITTILTYAICIPLGIVKALRHRTAMDNTTSVLIFCGYAVPGYALGAVLLSLFAVKYDWFPLGGFKGEQFDSLSSFGKAKDLAWHSFMPLICYMIGAFASTTMLMKNSLMENMSADYVKTALAKGLPWKRAIFVHALRNSLIPLATSIGGLLYILVAGSVLIERVFNIQGFGLLFFDSIQSRDYPVVMAITIITTLLLLFGNLISDITLAMVDPRIRFE